MRMFCLYPRLCLCLSVYPQDIFKTDAARSSNLTLKRSAVSPRNPFILGSKGQGYESQKNLCRSLPTERNASIYSSAADRLIIARVILTLYQYVTDRQTDSAPQHSPIHACNKSL